MSNEITVRLCNPSVAELAEELHSGKYAAPQNAQANSFHDRTTLKPTHEKKINNHSIETEAL